jgi:hypothetical protein
MFENSAMNVKELELNEESSKQLSDMTDEYMQKVEAEHGRNIRKIVEAMVSARMFNNAMISAFKVFKADAKLTTLCGTIVTSYAAISVAQVARGYGIEPTDEQIEQWDALATRFIDNANVIATAAAKEAFSKEKETSPTVH